MDRWMDKRKEGGQEGRKGGRKHLIPART